MLARTDPAEGDAASTMPGGHSWQRWPVGVAANTWEPQSLFPPGHQHCCVSVPGHCHRGVCQMPADASQESWGTWGVRVMLRQVVVDGNLAKEMSPGSMSQGNGLFPRDQRRVLSHSTFNHTATACKPIRPHCCCSEQGEGGRRPHLEQDVIWNSGWEGARAEAAPSCSRPRGTQPLPATPPEGSSNCCHSMIRTHLC